MKLSISELKFIQGSSGNGARCTINISATHPQFGELCQTTRGCLVFRDKFDRLAILTPVVYLGGRNGRRVKYRPIILSPGLHEWLAQNIEQRWGKHIVRNPDTLSGTHPSRVDPNLEDNYSEVVSG